LWKEESNALKAEFIFNDFQEAMSFLIQVAMESEKMNHHPTIINTYNKVWIELQTHDAGNVITSKDRKLSEQISRIYKRYIGS
jgi:4a-hydroxytetrahydrobiopterin dehydratase